MTEVFEHNPGDHDDPLTGPTWIIGFLGAVLLSVIVLGLTALVYNAQHKEEVEKLIKRDVDELETLRAQQQALLTGPPHWIQVQEKDDKGNEHVEKALVIPVDRAMELVVQGK